MKKIRLGICFLDEKKNILVKKDLEATWSVDVTVDLDEQRDILMKDEISDILISGFKLALTPEIIKEMLGELTI